MQDGLIIQEYNLYTSKQAITERMSVDCWWVARFALCFAFVQTPRQWPYSWGSRITWSTLSFRYPSVPGSVHGDHCKALFPFSVAFCIPGFPLSRSVLKDEPSPRWIMLVKLRWTGVLATALKWKRIISPLRCLDDAEAGRELRFESSNSSLNKAGFLKEPSVRRAECTQLKTSPSFIR